MKMNKQLYIIVLILSLVTVIICYWCSFPRNITLWETESSITWDELPNDVREGYDSLFCENDTCKEYISCCTIIVSLNNEVSVSHEYIHEGGGAGHDVLIIAGNKYAVLSGQQHFHVYVLYEDKLYFPTSIWGTRRVLKKNKFGFFYFRNGELINPGAG